MDRNIPDVRDIFGKQGQKGLPSRSKQELRSYEYSPRSRKRNDILYSSDYPHDNYKNLTRSKEANNSKQQSQIRDYVYDDFKDQKNRKSDQKNIASNNNKNRDSSHPSTRTLTERDIRHLERHLSMKKTIRKQISRNLAQAFVEDPDVILKDSCYHPVQTRDKPSNDKSFTLTRAKVSKSEQNVLELLKDNEPDSGHCSADNHCSSDDEVTQEEEDCKQLKSNKWNRTENYSRKENACKEEGKFSSFWKMFSVKSKGKR